jgi:metal-responsive CopG/Arc/MetJ family transcriptional regulator
VSGAGDYAFKRISDLETRLAALQNRDNRIVTALEKRVAKLEALVVGAASDVIKLEDKIAELERWKHDIEQFSEEIKRSALTRHMGDKT